MADLGARLGDQRQARLEIVRPFEVVEAGDRNVGGNAQARRSRRARITPMVARLLPVTSAVGGSARSSSARAASAARSVVPLPVTM